MTRAGHEVHRKEPLGEIRTRFVKDRSCSRIDMISAVLAGIRTSLVHRVESRPAGATRTNDFGSAIVNFHELGQACGIVWVFGLELLESVLCHDGTPLG